MKMPPDPRPRVIAEADGHVLHGQRCTDCGSRNAVARARCPDCRGELAPATYGPSGTVWSSTVVRIPVPGRTPPFALAYVDLAEGPRVLAHVAGVDEPVPVGTSVQLSAPNEHGDVVVEVDA
jgi:uncharacterized protein